LGLFRLPLGAKSYEVAFINENHSLAVTDFDQRQTNCSMS
jgi:hypothetical protein